VPRAGWTRLPCPAQARVCLVLQDAQQEGGFMGSALALDQAAAEQRQDEEEETDSLSSEEDVRESVVRATQRRARWLQRSEGCLISKDVLTM